MRILFGSTIWELGKNVICFYFLIFLNFFIIDFFFLPISPILKTKYFKSILIKVDILFAPKKLYLKNKNLMQDIKQINHAFYSRYWLKLWASVTPKVPFASGLHSTIGVTSCA